MKIGFIGCGNMAQPIIKNVAEKNVFDKSDIFVYDIDKDKLASFCASVGINEAEDECFIAKNCQVVMLCTKPQTFPVVLEKISNCVKENSPMLVSIAAGKTTDSICEMLGFDTKVARIFPNLNATVGQAISAYTGNSLVSGEELSLVGKIAASYGEAIELGESLFSAFGVLGGCAPAYTFMFIGALAKAGELNGIDRDTAISAAIQTVLGSAMLLKECGGDIEEWVSKVCSPGGTTIEGVKSLRESDIYNVVSTAFSKSYNRDKELQSK